jgi:quercetin dioxygenase-like cupin family protein
MGRRGDEKASLCTAGCGSHVDVGHEQEGNIGVHPRTSAMVHSALLHRWPRTSPTVRGLESGGGWWVDRVKIPAGGRVLAHTHPQDELVTVIDGTWYLGEGTTFNPASLKAYPAGSFIVIPANVPHFVAAKEADVIIQLNGNGKFHTDSLEK